MIPVNTPKISVKLIKNSSRNIRVQLGPNMPIDLTPYLQEGSSVSTQKALNNPNGGFTIRMGDQWVAAFGSSVYGLVEPMDAVEIRMSRTGKPVLVMRGLVTTVNLAEAMSADGKPSRGVTITGGDYGAFLRMIQIHTVRGQDVGNLMLALSQEFMREVYGIANGAPPAAEFIKKLVSMVINRHIGRLGNPSLPAMKVDARGADQIDMAYMLGYQANPEGTMWSHIQTHGNLGPFYEMFLDDAEDGTTLVYRKPPFKKWHKDGGGEFIFPTSNLAGVETFKIKAAEITDISRSRTELDVANFYYVRAPRGDFFTDTDSKLMSIVGDGTKLSTATVPNCEESVYGFRMLEASTNHGNMLVRGEKAAEHEAGSSNLTTYMLQQIKYLQDCNVDNVVFETGTIRCNGSPDYKPGRYCEIAWSNGVKFTGYVTSVSHVFEPMRGYTCTLQYIRGTEYGSKTAAENPYFRGKGVYE